MNAIDFTCLAIVDHCRSAHLGVLPLGDKFYLIPLSVGVRRLVKKKTLDCTVSFMVQMLKKSNLLPTVPRRFVCCGSYRLDLDLLMLLVA